MNKLIKADEYLDALNELRLLVLLECDLETCGKEIEEPHFHQVIINERQFKTVSDTILEDSHKDKDLREGYEMAQLSLSGNHFDSKQFDGLSSTGENAAPNNT